MNKFILLLFIFLTSCSQIQDDIEIVDDVLQEEEKIYDNLGREKSVRVKRRFKIKGIKD